MLHLYNLERKSKLPERGFIFTNNEFCTIGILLEGNLHVPKMAGTEEVTVVAVLSPKDGKKEKVSVDGAQTTYGELMGAQIIELLTAMIAGVTANEPQTLQYEMFVQDDSDDIVMVEK